MEKTPHEIRKSSSVIAWLGFGISLVVFLMVWLVNILVFYNAGDIDFPIAALYMLLIMAGGFLGLLGLIFSIVGLVQSMRNYTSKWIGLCGIVLCCISVLSIFAPVIVAGFIKNQTIDVVLPESGNENDMSKKDCIVLKITRYKKIKCYDNRNGKDYNPANISIYSIDLLHELSTWMQMNDIDKNASIVIETETDVDYSDVVDLLDILKSMGMTKYRTTSALMDS